MKLPAGGTEKSGLYLGTEIDEKWWRRYKKDKLFARGNGKYWHDERAFYFRRYLTKAPITIPFQNVLEVKVGTWHAGRWGSGRPVVKIVWKKDDILLSSGFLVSLGQAELHGLKDELRKKIAPPPNP